MGLAALSWPQPAFAADVDNQVSDLNLPQGSLQVEALFRTADKDFAGGRYQIVCNGLGMNHMLCW